MGRRFFCHLYLTTSTNVAYNFQTNIPYGRLFVLRSFVNFTIFSSKSSKCAKTTQKNHKLKRLVQRSIFLRSFIKSTVKFAAFFNDNITVWKTRPEGSWLTSSAVYVFTPANIMRPSWLISSAIFCYSSLGKVQETALKKGHMHIFVCTSI